MHRYPVLRYGYGVSMYTIGQLAKQVGVNVETIRYYERKGLIEQPSKPNQGFRHYSEDQLSRVLFIKKAQNLGFALSEIALLLELSLANCHDVEQLAAEKLKSIKQKIEDLKKLESSLTALVDQCHNNQNASECPIIRALIPTETS